jgi:hypothetical protein
MVIDESGITLTLFSSNSSALVCMHVLFAQYVRV